MKENQSQYEYVRRSQKDYPLTLKLKIVSKLETGQLNLNEA